MSCNLWVGLSFKKLKIKKSAGIRRKEKPHFWHCQAASSTHGFKKQTTALANIQKLMLTLPEDAASYRRFEADVWKALTWWHGELMHRSYLSWAIRWSSRCCSAARRTGGRLPSGRPRSRLRTHKPCLRTPWLPPNGRAWEEEKPSPTGWLWCHTCMVKKIKGNNKESLF